MSEIFDALSLPLTGWFQCVLCGAWLYSETWLTDLIEAFATHMPHIVTTLATERNTAGQVATEPATNDARAPLTTCSFKSGSRLSLLSTIRTLYCLRRALRVHPRHSLVFLELLRAQKLSKLFLSRVLCGLGIPTASCHIIIVVVCLDQGCPRVRY